MEYIFKTPIGVGEMVAQIRGWGWLQKKGEKAGIAEQEANARLIASAPDMYEALKDLIECVDPENGNGFISKVEWHNARDAIAKAEGVTE